MGLAWNMNCNIGTESVILYKLLALILTQLRIQAQTRNLQLNVLIN